MKYLSIIFVPFIFVLTGCSDSEVADNDTPSSDIIFPDSIAQSAKGYIRPPIPNNIYNHEAVIPPQCYTKHDSEFNPCMTCHQNYDYRSRPNMMQDGDLQLEYAFSEVGETNHWSNLFEDRRSRIANISDQQAVDYIFTDNYSTLIEQLRELSDWQGPIPEIKNLHTGAGAFDTQGFALDGSHWVAFNYKPLPSTFWPTNGSTDDVMVKLPEKFRTSSCKGDVYSRDTYLANLGILEAAIKDLDVISVPELDENEFCTDLNQDGVLTRIQQINRPEFYVGAASAESVTVMLYPEQTEFLHTVRYVGVTAEGEITPAARMKEVRYMYKYRFHSPNDLLSRYINEQQEKVDELLPRYVNRRDNGTDNGFGWLALGFIEAEDGHLRLQSEEETLFCMGCHTTIGTTIDQTFAFPRKVTGAEGWSYIDLKGMPDAPSVNGGPEGEIFNYLKAVGGGNEFRENDEIKQKFFNADNTLNEAKVRQSDVYQLTTPSVRRALDLNKAYMTIVQDQDFIYGRDANIAPAVNVHQTINAQTPTLPRDKSVKWDIRNDW